MTTPIEAITINLHFPTTSQDLGYELTNQHYETERSLSANDNLRSAWVAEYDRRIDLPRVHQAQVFHDYLQIWIDEMTKEV